LNLICLDRPVGGFLAGLSRKKVEYLDVFLSLQLGCCIISRNYEFIR
jgi:hypothetical protein